MEPQHHIAASRARLAAAEPAHLRELRQAWHDAIKVYQATYSATDLLEVGRCKAAYLAAKSQATPGYRVVGEAFLVHPVAA